MKILVINNGAFPYNGGNGCSVQLNSILEAFSSSSHKIFFKNICTFYSGATKTDAINELKKLKLKLFEPHESPEVNHNNNIIKDIINTLNPNIREFYNGYDYTNIIDDTINMTMPDHIYFYNVNALVAYDFDKHKIPYSFSNVDIESLVHKYKYDYRGNNGIKHSVRLLLKKIRAKKTNQVLYNSIKKSKVCFEHAYQHQQYLSSLGLNNVVYLPVNVNDRKRIPTTFKNDSNAIRIGLIGNVQGIATLSGVEDFTLNYLHELEKLPYFRMMEIKVFGGGKLRPTIEIELFKQPNIKRIGYVDKLDDIYNNLDIVLVPTPIELGFRTRIVESFSFSKTVITHKANANAMPEFVHNKNGFSYSNPKEMIAILNTIVKDKGLLKNISNNARITYEDQLKGELIGAKMIELIEK